MTSFTTKTHQVVFYKMWTNVLARENTTNFFFSMKYCFFIYFYFNSLILATNSTKKYVYVDVFGNWVFPKKHHTHQHFKEFNRLVPPEHYFTSMHAPFLRASNSPHTLCLMAQGCVGRAPTPTTKTPNPTSFCISDAWISIIEMQGYLDCITLLLTDTMHIYIGWVVWSLSSSYAPLQCFREPPFWASIWFLTLFTFALALHVKTVRHLHHRQLVSCLHITFF